MRSGPRPKVPECVRGGLNGEDTCQRVKQTFKYFLTHFLDENHRESSSKDSAAGSQISRNLTFFYFYEGPFWSALVTWPAKKKKGGTLHLNLW